MLIELMRECRNFFVIASTCGAFTLSGGTLTPCPVLGDEYILMTGSASADGLYRLSGNTLLDPDTGEQADVPNQTFTGTIMTCRLPSDFLRLSADIAAYDAAAPAGGVVTESITYSSPQPAIPVIVDIGGYPQRPPHGHRPPPPPPYYWR